MRYRIILYDRASEDMGGIIGVPRKHLGQVLTIAGITDTHELGELSLDEEQVRDIAALVGFTLDWSRFHYHLEPIAPALARVPA